MIHRCISIHIDTYFHIHFHIYIFVFVCVYWYVHIYITVPPAQYLQTGGGGGCVAPLCTS
jgi:hypothetical protein